MQLKEEIANIGAKNAICKIKSNTVEQQTVVEKEIGEKIDEVTPVKFTLGNSIEKNGQHALVAAKNELHKFYSSFSQNENYDGLFFAFISTFPPINTVFFPINL